MMKGKRPYSQKAVRPTRVLIGWIPGNAVAPWHAAIQADGTARAKAVDFARRARQAVAARSPVGIQNNAVTAAPAALDAYLHKLRQVPDYLAMLSQGFHVALADLTQLFALQPQVHIDQAMERVEATDPNDIVALASLSLPLSSSAPIAVSFDDARQTWAFSSPNPNLRILGRFNAELEPDGYGFGFSIGVTPSFLQVTRFRNRYFLRDGYHRAYGLLAKGIRFVPVMMHECQTDSEFALPNGMLARSIVLGERAPRLVDFFDDGVSATVQMAATEKIVTIHGRESLQDAHP